MPASPDPAHSGDGSPEAVALRSEVSALMHRWQHAGMPLYELAMVLATVGCQALGHAVGPVPPPEGPEIIQRITHELQQQAETCYFQHWQGDSSAI
jgi:hypothetical protein